MTGEYHRYALPKARPHESPRAYLARIEDWLGGDWDSRSSRGVRAADAWAAERDRMRAVIAERDARGIR